MKAEEDTLVPKDVLEEVLDTPSAFPFGDSSIKRLLARDDQSAFYELDRNRSLNLARYEYWNEELRGFFTPVFS